MRPAYIRVELGDPDNEAVSTFVVSPVPFVWHSGEILIPPKSQQRNATSYPELCEILTKVFYIPKALLPPEKYFRPTNSEKQEACWDVYRTVPEGTGEPEWRMKAWQAVISLLEDDDTLFEKGQVAINDRFCYSLEELQEELERVAEQVGERRKMKGEAYQPDYDVLVKYTLKGYTTLLSHAGLPKSRKKK